MTGPHAFSLVREHGGDLPFIFVSSAHGEDAAVDAMRIGAQDYLSKGNLARLAPAVEHGLREAAQRRERLRESERVVVSRLSRRADRPAQPNAAPRSAAPGAARGQARDAAAGAAGSRSRRLQGHQRLARASRRRPGAAGRRRRGCARRSVSRTRWRGSAATSSPSCCPRPTPKAPSSAGSKMLQEIEMPMVVADRTVFVRGSIGVADVPRARRQRAGADAEGRHRDVCRQERSLRRRGVFLRS